MEGESDFLSLTDIVKAKEGDFFVSDWLRNANTLEYLGEWEAMHNPDFNYGEYATIRSKAGVNHYKISVKEWVEKTHAIGLRAKAGRYGGTYAHKDIAFHFCMWISPKFQLYVVKEYQRLKEQENNRYNLEWNVRRILSKTNYQLHTDAVKAYRLPTSMLPKGKQGVLYAEEADLLNIALFGCTAKEWSEANPQRVLAGENIRDTASINELTILSNIEHTNSLLLKNGLDKEERLRILRSIATEQKERLDQLDIMKAIRRVSTDIYLAQPPEEH